ncbi:MAG: hypothetical protein AW07_02373 [Candidatus Accumulibacter sp. SK-11]|nr:MAG: hypothetical protein AW07_02373 [Candidatus Accumulibacter sp. SK-11]
MHGLHLMEACVAGERAQNAQAQFVEQRRDMPELPGDVVFADEVHVVYANARPVCRRRDRCRLARADDVLEHGFTGDAIAEILGAVEAGAVDRQHRHAPARAGRSGHGLDIVADQRRNTGGVKEDGLWRVVVDRLLDGQEQAFLATAHDHVLLGEVGGHADAIECRARRARAAVVPGSASAADRPVHDVGDVGNRQQRNLRAVERAAAGGCAGFGARATGFFIPVVGTGGLVQQFGDFGCLHGVSPLLPLMTQVPCHR